MAISSGGQSVRARSWRRPALFESEGRHARTQSKALAAALQQAARVVLMHILLHKTPQLPGVLRYALAKLLHSLPSCLPVAATGRMTDGLCLWLWAVPHAVRCPAPQQFGGCR